MNPPWWIWVLAAVALVLLIMLLVGHQVVVTTH